MDRLLLIINPYEINKKSLFYTISPITALLIGESSQPSSFICGQLLSPPRHPLPHPPLFYLPFFTSNSYS